MYEGNHSRLLAIILELIGQYLVWIITITIIALWYFFPDVLESYGNLLFLWSPVIIIICGLLLVLLKHKIKCQKDREQGITQYEIIVTKNDFYKVELLIYLGALGILFIPFIFGNGKIDIFDVMQAFAYLLLTYIIQQVFFKKILK